MKDIQEQAVAKAEQSFLESPPETASGRRKASDERHGITSREVYSKLKKYGVNLSDYRRLTG
jgi:DNA-binding NtrC family response regulator